MQFLELQQQFVEPRAGGRIEETLAQGVGADGAPLADGRRHLRRYRADQLAELAHLALAVLAEPGLGDEQLDEYLCATEQLLRPCALALQGPFGLHGLQAVEQPVALGLEFGYRRTILAERRQRLEPPAQPLLDVRDARFQIAGLAGLADDRIDLQQIVEGLQATPDLKSATQQRQALQFDPGVAELAIGIAHQIEAGDQQRQEEQHADQAELHAEAEPVHQRDSGIEYGLHPDVS